MIPTTAMSWLLAGALALVGGGCGPGGNSSLGDGGVCTTDAGTAGDGTKAFGQACENGCECASGICFTFGDGTRACTEKCDDASKCPAGSQGKKCNQQGYCRT